MQLSGIEIEQEAARLLPNLIEELFDREGEGLRLQTGGDSAFDLFAEGHGRRWIFEVKSSSSPGLVSAAAEHLHSLPAATDTLTVLVVPFMTPAGEKAAESRRLNWVDLSGNAHIRDDRLYIFVKGRPSKFVSRGRPSSPFAPKSARITRLMLLDPERWWQRKELSTAADLNSGQVSRVVRRLLDEGLVEQQEDYLVRPRHPQALLDAWEDEYRFDRHQVLRCHMSGTGIELSRRLEEGLSEGETGHAFTGLAAAWALRGFARFRLNSVFVREDPHEIAIRLGLRMNERGSNVQLIFPDDAGVFIGAQVVQELTCVAPVQAYLDLKHLPERAAEAAENLRERGLWNGA
jgi:hypothetical protein